MLKIVIPDQKASRNWDDEMEVFIPIPAAKGCELTLEHSLLSISKWESIWCKPFLKKEERTIEETLSYIECMIVSPSNVDPEIIKRIPIDEFNKIDKYINNPATATTFGRPMGSGVGHNNDIITSELIYYWMVAANIPFECQKWHLNRLLALIRICEIKNNPKGQPKMTANEIRKNYDKINEERRRRLNSKG